MLIVFIVCCCMVPPSSWADDGCFTVSVMLIVFIVCCCMVPPSSWADDGCFTVSVMLIVFIVCCWFPHIVWCCMVPPSSWADDGCFTVQVMHIIFLPPLGVVHRGDCWDRCRRPKTNWKTDIACDEVLHNKQHINMLIFDRENGRKLVRCGFYLDQTCCIVS